MLKGKQIIEPLVRNFLSCGCASWTLLKEIKKTNQNVLRQILSEVLYLILITIPMILSSIDFKVRITCYLIFIP